MLIEFNGKRPQVAEDVFIAPNAVLIGDVVVERGASIWFGVVLRADTNQIIIGEGANIQDNCVLHTNDTDYPTTIGPYVSVGHSVTMEACIIERGALIGMGAVILSGARVGEKAMVAAGAVVAERAIVPAGHLVAGIPAVVKKELSGSSLTAVEYAATHYVELAQEYLKEGIGHPDSHI